MPGRLGMDLLPRGDWVPRVDIAETDTAYVIKMEIPEVDKKDVKVAVDNGVLTIRGERKQEKEEKGRRYHRMERYFGSFERAFAVITSYSIHYTKLYEPVRRSWPPRSHAAR